MKKEVIVYTCDSCKDEAESESNKPKDWKRPLPYGWVDINVVSNDGVMANMQLCDDCWAAITVALSDRTNNANQEKK